MEKKLNVPPNFRKPVRHLDDYGCCHQDFHLIKLQGLNPDDITDVEKALGCTESLVCDHCIAHSENWEEATAYARKLRLEQLRNAKDGKI